MKKITLALLAVLLSGFMQVKGQYIPAVNPEFVFPTPALAGNTQTHHMSAYDYVSNIPSLPPGNFNVYSWSGNDPAAINNAGIAYTFRNLSNTLVWDENFIHMDVKELEVGFIELNNSIFIVAIYESFSGGVFMDVYRYNFMGTPTPIVTNQLIDPSGSKPRMSTYKTSQFVCTFESPNGIGVSAYMPGMAAPSLSYINGTVGCVMPDIAFTSFSNMDVYVSYFNPMSNAIHVEHEDFSIIASASGVVPFFTDDVNPLGVVPEYIDIDCMGSMAIASANVWSYVYDQNNDLFVRMFNPATSTFYDMMLTNPLVNTDFKPRKPSIAMDYNSSSIDIAWSQESLSGMMNNIIGKKIDLVGGYIVPFSDFVIIPTAPMFSPHLYSLVALSKNKLTGNDVFTAFCLDNGTPIMRNYYKFKTAIMSTYKLPELEMPAIAYPNPFTDQLALNIPSIDGDVEATVSITDLSGRNIFMKQGTIDAINTAINTQHHQWNNGMYLISITHKDMPNPQIIKITKQ